MTNQISDTMLRSGGNVGGVGEEFVKCVNNAATNKQ